MALIKCPECGKEISSKSKACIHCGYPISEDYELLQIANQQEELENQIPNFDHDKICPVCKAQMFEYEKDRGVVACQVCGYVIATNEYIATKWREKRKQEIDNKDNSTPSPSTPQPHCPTCGSTNVKRISAASKVAGAYAFGLFSKTAKSQFKCGDCGYKW